MNYIKYYKGIRQCPHSSVSNRARYIACRCTDSESLSRTLYTLCATLILYTTGDESSRSLRSDTACSHRTLSFALWRYSWYLSFLSYSSYRRCVKHTFLLWVRIRLLSRRYFYLSLNRQFFLSERHTVRVGRIIACVKLSNIINQSILEGLIRAMLQLTERNQLM